MGLTSSFKTCLKFLAVSILTGPLAGYIPAETRDGTSERANMRVVDSMVDGFKKCLRGVVEVRTGEVSFIKLRRFPTRRVDHVSKHR